jgi:DNA invertase Pin-like site-specific DNA recombinase
VCCPGATATDDNRPEFQKMVERATDKDHPYDIILVHSYSRFFRDAFALEMYVRRFRKHDVRLISITQELGDDPAQAMMRQIIGLFDEYQSKEISKHVLRSMKENARQSFYNGSALALGYKAVPVEKRGDRVKKKIVVDPIEADLVLLIFCLYLRGDGASGPLGTKQIAAYLNGRGYRTRRGAHFGTGTIQQILRNRISGAHHLFRSIYR